MPDRPPPANAPRARLLALEGATVCFFAVTVLGLVAGAEGHVAALRGLVGGALVAFAGPFPIRVVLDALGAAHDDAGPTAPGASPPSAPSQERRPT